MLPLINPDNTCCFTGHRPEKLPWGTDEEDPGCLRLKSRLYDIAGALYHSGIRHFICGMARGCDLYFAETALSLRDEFEDITVEAAIPCETQASRWSAAEKKQYFNILHRCDYQTVISKEYTPDCMLKRNKYMVDNSSVLIAVYDGASGGTRHTVNYAAKKGLEIIELRP